jgi:DNA mismatch repair ATPase MutL
MRTVRRDGRMDAAGPAPCAAVQVTTLVVEDLFYNMLTRKKASLLAPSQP